MGFQSAQTVGRAIDLLKIVSSSRACKLRLVDIAEMASLDKSTAHRLLQRLVHERMLVHHSRHGYRLGPLLHELGLAALPETDLREVSWKALRGLAQITGDMVFLVARSGFDTVCLNRITGHFPIQTMTRMEGDRHPLGVGAGGLAILASLSDPDIEIAMNAIEPRIHSYRLSRATILEAVALSRRRGGLAVDDGIAAPNVTAIGWPVFNQSETPFAAVFVASTNDRMIKKRQEQISIQLFECTKAIESALR